MWWSRRASLVGILALGGCGFTPVYGTGGAAEGLRGEIAVAAPRDEPGYLLVRQLEDRLGAAGAVRYRLEADIRLVEDGLGVTPDQEITRFRLRGRVVYTLRELDGDVVTEGVVETFTSYSAPVFSEGRDSIAGNAVTVRSAERDARLRLMVALADQIVSRLLATAPEWRQ